ncbi:mandelate racemase/muconate lactonizing enzyme family protein [Ramlibacter sp. Leaf400]|uniref:mandelate racemase/muconate lactonizing enzyme family protein n=1 Tax=Ramlibacter sp. Leaf400 TaxID=1736365 RepID=UPI0006F81A13|nr:mandelate racemase/muconate lactonizing enzyme family protein [Ramlibacter sp. Leaf400]KQT08107.1 mandelate racemase [Ramlibacter sp. Leaf400]
MNLRPLPSLPVRPVRVQAFVLRAPIATPVQTSFGTMHDRPALFVRVEDEDGAFGWGEVWCNFPSCGAEHRARLVETVLAPLLTARAWPDPAEAFESLSRATAVLALQSGEPGPIAQAIAGLDLALWDLCARRAGQPLWQLLGGEGDEVAVYASGINPTNPERIVAERHDDGYRAFKLKIGFGRERDLANLATLRRQWPGLPLMTDANQAWTLAETLDMLPALEGFGLGWLEEPLRADRPWSEWQQLAAAGTVPLAGGENVSGHEAFDAAIASGALRVLQPDIAKWGGISGCWPVVQRGLASGLRYCPHYLGGGIGLLASAHLLAAVQAPAGMLEVDANPNPLRTLLAPVFTRPQEGRCRLGTAPGLGIVPDLDAVRREIRA